MEKPSATYWRLAFNNRETARVISRCDYDEDSCDALLFRRGKRVSSEMLTQFQFCLQAGKGPITDHVANPLGWIIWSQRLVDHLFPMIKECVELKPITLGVEKSTTKVEGYFVVNVIRVVDCIIESMSTPRIDEDNKQHGYIDYCVDEARTAGANIFKYTDSTGYVDYGVTCSNQLAQSLAGKGFRGIALIKCCRRST